MFINRIFSANARNGVLKLSLSKKMKFGWGTKKLLRNKISFGQVISSLEMYEYFFYEIVGIMDEGEHIIFNFCSHHNIIKTKQYSDEDRNLVSKQSL